MMAIKAEWLTGRGYKLDPVFGATKDFGDTTILVGYFPRNSPCVSLRFAGVEATVITQADSHEDILLLERLLGEVVIDHDTEECLEVESP